MYLQADELTTKQFADALPAPLSTVKLWCKLGRVLSKQTPGGRYRIPASEVERVRNGEPLPDGV